MKKIIALLVLAAMMLTFAACTSENKTNDTDKVTNDTTVADVETTEPETTVAEESAAAAGHKFENPETVAQKLCYAFEETYDADNAVSAQTMADTLLANEVIKFGPATMPVEPGFLNGFNNEINGFAEAITFSPMIGTIPFMGYIFVLEDGADVEAFVATLEAEANLCWNICTEAEEMVTNYRDNMVFFCMSPLEFEE